MKNIFLLLFFCISFVACTALPKNSVYELTTPQHALVKVETADISSGDRVRLMKRTCVQIERKNNTSTRCSESVVGEASVLSLDSNKVAAIKADENVLLEKGLLVERVTK